MSKISIYDVVPVPKLADKLIGTSVGGEPEDLTYNFTLGELLNLFIPNIPGNTLQGVLDFGNTATQDINLIGTINTTDLNVGGVLTILDSDFTGETHILGGLYDSLNSIGTPGQVLISTGTNVEWFTIPTVIPNLQQVLTSGNTAVNNIILTGNLSANNAALLTSTISTSLTLLGTLRDGLSSVGANNQVLSSNVTGVRWVNLPVYSAASPLLYNSGTGVFSIQQSNASQGGFLSAADWITFDGKQTAIILTTTGSSGPSTLVGSTINVPNYTLSGLGGVPQTRTLTINGVTFDLSANRSWTIAAGVSSVTASSPLFSTGGATPNITIQQSSSTLDGYLSSVDWLTFNSKQALLGGTGLVKSVGGTISYITDNSVNWNTAYNDSIVSAAVTGTTTKTLTLNQQDGGTITASWSDIDTGLTSVGVSMPAAFSVSNSPLTSNGTIAITGSGNALQYVDGTGALQSFPSLTGFVPYTGATANVNLGIYSLTASALIKNGGTSGQFLKADGSVDSSAYIVLGSLSASAPLSYNNTTGAFSIIQSGTVTDGYLSSTDWNTFNSKQGALTLTTTGTSGASTLIGNTLNIPTYTDQFVGTVTSVGLSMPSAFTVSNSPVTSAGTLTVVGAGLASQYVRGDGALGDFPNTGGGGSSVSYYLNGSVNQGTFVGNTYYEMNKTPVIGAGTDFSIATNGYIAQFITDANDPASLLIPGGNWNVEMYFSASSSGGTPSFYVEVYKYNGTTFTLLGSSVTTPEGITNGTAIDIYYTSVGIPETALTLTDRIAIRVYVNHSGRTITLHTEDNHLSEIVTTFSNGLTALNGLTTQVQYLATGTSGSDFNIASSVATHTFNLPTASAVNRGALSAADWTTFNNKQPAGNYVTLDTTQTITALKTILRSGDVLNFKIGVDTLYGLKIAYNQNELAPAGEATWSFVNTFNNGSGTGLETTPISFFRGVLVTGERLLSVSVNTNLLDYYGNNPSGRYPIYAYNTGVQQFQDSILVGFNTGVVNAVTGAIASLPAGVVANFNGRVIGSNAVNSNEFATLGQLTGGTVTSVGLSSVTSGVTIGSTPITTSGNITIAIATATGSQNGLLSSTDWTTFNSKQGAITLTTTGTSGASTLVGNTLNIPNYTTDLTGYVPYTGATQDVNLGVYSISVNSVLANAVTVNPSGTNAGQIFFKHGSTFTLPSGFGSIGSDVGNQFKLYQVTSVGVFRGATLSLNNITASQTRDFAFPDASGTIALVGGVGVGTVTSVSFTLGSTGTDLSASVANSTTTPAITLNVPTASATNRGALSAADWTTFNNKTSNVGTVTSVGLSSATSGVTIGSTPVTTSGTITLAIATASGSQNGLLSSTDWTTFNNKQNALTNPVTGTGTTNYLPKFTGASTIGNSQVFDDGTNVGIGTIIPGSKFDVTNTIGTAYDASNTLVSGQTMRIANLSTSSSIASTLLFIATGGGGGNGLGSISGVNTATGSLALTFGTRDSGGSVTERARITSGGNLLVGTTTDAGFKLDVNGTGRFISSGGYFSIDSNGQVTSTQSLDVATAGGRFTGMSSRGALGAIHIEQTTTGANGGYIAFRTSDSGSTTPTEKMRIASTGDATFSSVETNFNFNPQTNLLSGYKYLNFGGGSIMYRNTTDFYIGSNGKYGSAGTVVANYTSSSGMGLLTMDGGNLNWQGNNASVTAGSAYAVPVRFTITGAGNVGIGTSTPSSQLSGTIGLSIVNATNAALGLSNGTNHWLNYLSGTTYRIWNNSVAEVMTLTYGGNVLIGTTTDNGNKLQVEGNANIKDARIITNFDNVLNGGTVTVNTQGGGFGGFMIISSTLIVDPNFRTITTYSYFGRGTGLTVSQIATANGTGGGQSFSVQSGGSGIIQVTNTSGSTCKIIITLFGAVSP